MALRVKTSILSIKKNPIKSWDYIKSEYNLESKLKYRWIQLAGALPKLWKCHILNCREYSMNLYF